jgi:hypothetical protein
MIFIHFLILQIPDPVAAPGGIVESKHGVYAWAEGSGSTGGALSNNHLNQEVELRSLLHGEGLGAQCSESPKDW